MKTESDNNKEPLILSASNKKKVKRKSILYRYRFFVFMNLCMILAFFTSDYGGSKGIVNESIVIWYFAVPLIYLEAGTCCEHKELFSVLRDGYLLLFLMLFVYLLVPALAALGCYALSYYTGLNVRLLKGIEVLHCLPPPFTTSLALSRIAHADIPTSVVTTLTCHFGGLVLSPILLYIMVKDILY